MRLWRVIKSYDQYIQGSRRELMAVARTAKPESLISSTELRDYFSYYLNFIFSTSFSMSFVSSFDGWMVIARKSITTCGEHLSYENGISVNIVVVCAAESLIAQRSGRVKLIVSLKISKVADAGVISAASSCILAAKITKYEWKSF